MSTPRAARYADTRPNIAAMAVTPLGRVPSRSPGGWLKLSRGIAGQPFFRLRAHILYHDRSVPEPRRSGSPLVPRLYHVEVHELSQGLLKHIRRQALLAAGDRVAVAVSGGADSVALLRLFTELRGELGITISVVHFNHKLREPESDEDEAFVAALAQGLGLELDRDQAEVGEYAKAHSLSLEAAGRRLRYGFFARLGSARKLKVATAHTLDDQAETVMIKIVRGAGLRGLAAIHPQVAMGQEPVVATILRPLLETRRREIEAYLKDIGQAWREDSSNRDTKFLRNRVRHVLMPLLRAEFNPEVDERLAELAEIARAEDGHWKQEHSALAELAVARADATVEIGLKSLRALPLAAQRRLVMGTLKAQGCPAPSFRQIEEVLNLARPESKRGRGTVELPGGITVRHRRGQLYFGRERGEHVEEYEYPLPVPGVVEIAEIGSRFEVVFVPLEDAVGGTLLARNVMETKAVLRNWRPGDRLGGRKVKDLLSQRQISGLEKKLWPLVEVEGKGIVWARGFAVPRDYQPEEGAKEGVLIRGVVAREGRPQE